MSELPYTALVTVGDVRRAALQSFGEAVLSEMQDETSEVYEACVDIIVDVTDEIERFLNRQIIVRPQTLRFDVGHLSVNPSTLSIHDVPMQGDWRTEPGYYTEEGLNEATLEYLLLAWARQWPVVQVRSVDGSEDLAGLIQIIDDARRLAFDETAYFDAAQSDVYPREIAVFAGYRRRDQAVAGSGDPIGSGEEDLASIDDLAGLTVEPPVLPGQIRRRAVRLVIHEMREELQGLVGVSRTSKRIEQMTVESTSRQAGFVQMELEKLTPFKYFAV